MDFADGLVGDVEAGGDGGLGQAVEVDKAKDCFFFGSQAMDGLAQLLAAAKIGLGNGGTVREQVP